MGKDLLKRETALDARPVRREVLETSHDADGSLRLTLEFGRPRWQCRLGAPPVTRRTFVLDEIGAEVYEDCDGSNSVSALAGKFAGRYKVSLAEAEYSVSEYLKTMMKKGLVNMEVDRAK